VKDAPSDADLIERSQREPGCFVGIFDRHGTEILRYAHARLGPDGPAGDTRAGIAYKGIVEITTRPPERQAIRG
jgi:hypothetical protein